MFYDQRKRRSISMSSPVLTSEQAAIAALYEQLLNCWNQRDARAFAALFDNDALCIGFDGSSMNGRAEIEVTLGHIFTDHVTATYVSKIRRVRLLASDVAILHAVVGMISPGSSDINPAVN